MGSASLPFFSLFPLSYADGNAFTKVRYNGGSMASKLDPKDSEQYSDGPAGESTRPARHWRLSIVGRVLAGPAAQAGFEPGDIIETVDCASANEMTLTRTAAC
jgi:hypothetical protein